MLNDPEVDKLIIYVLAGLCAVLALAVIYLAVKKNIYYVDDDGNEIPPKAAKKKIKKEKSAAVTKAKAAAPVADEAAEAMSDETTIMSFNESEPALQGVNRLIDSQPAAQADEEAVTPVFPDEPEEEEAAEAVPQVSAVVAEVTIAGNTSEHTVSVLPCTIGRDSNRCDLVLPEPAVSRVHARFMQDGSGLYIEDLSEHNGTFVNGRKLASLGKMKIKEGDGISLGRAQIVIKKLIY